MKKLFAYIQFILPQYLLTYLMGKLAELKTPWLKNFFIQTFIKIYKIDMSIAEIEDPKQYPTFNSFFTRQLKPELRCIANAKNEIASPVDGFISQIGQIRKNQLLQVKDFYFDLEGLLGGDTLLASQFYDGAFATLYLAPHHYHRIHMPLTGKLEKTIYVPGKLFSVNQMTTEYIPQLYSRNERLICIFSTQVGPVAVILVGAMIVGSIQTVWLSSAIRSKKINISYPATEISLPIGAECAQFKLGSTVLLLFGKNKITWKPACGPGSAVQFGQLIGNINI